MKPKEAVKKMSAYVSPGEGRMEFVRLDFNENVRGASPKVIEALKNITAEECTCYPEYEIFTQTLASFLKVSPKAVLPTNGIDEAIKALYETYVDKGDEVVLLMPSYSLYELFAQLVDAKIVWVDYPDDFSFPIETVLKAITPKTRLIALACPNNPTGTLISEKNLRRIIESNPSMVVLIDEAYVDFAKTDYLKLAFEYPNVFITRTFSKAFGLAGFRIGTLISSEENIADVAKIVAPAYSVDRAAMVAATAAIEDRSYVEAYVDEVLEQREKFCGAMRRLGFRVIPSEANFVLVDFGDCAEQVVENLKSQGILVRLRQEKCLKGFLRISIGTQEQMRRVVMTLEPYATKPALIFDMDGVLIDESESYRECIIKTVFNLAGQVIDRNAIEEFKSQGGCNNDYDCTAQILNSFGVSIAPQTIIETFDDFYRDLKCKERWLLDESILSRLAQNYRLGIFTGRPKRDALEALRRFNTAAFFEVVITDDDVSKRKPDPEGIFLVLKRLNVKTAIYVGDTCDDAEAAKRSNIEFIGVMAPGSSHQQFEVPIVLQRIEDLEEVLCPKE